jgi:hypothetical protein
MKSLICALALSIFAMPAMADKKNEPVEVVTGSFECQYNFNSNPVTKLLRVNVLTSTILFTNEGDATFVVNPSVDDCSVEHPLALAVADNSEAICRTTAETLTPSASQSFFRFYCKGSREQVIDTYVELLDVVFEGI